MAKKEFKLGFFVLGAIVILVFAIFSISDFRILNPGYALKVKFNFGDGIKPASPVRIAGTDAGEVKRVSLINEEGRVKVLVYVWIRKGIKVPVGSEAFVNSLGILGEKYIEIIPKEYPEAYLEDGSVIVGRDSFPMYKISEFARKTLVRFDTILNSVAKIVKKEDIAETFKKFIGNLQSASSDLEIILRDLKQSRGTVGRLVYEDTLYQELEEFIKDLKAHPWKLIHKPAEAR
ncbi:MlaD family protein [Candidatus Omnitrophota bacterium]